ncbi:MAG TPA: hypothetical protein VK013_13155 [Myxococcaceae bacterium]|nr:hypothetical protein [Myxococcaceae bacterium]
MHALSRALVAFPLFLALTACGGKEPIDPELGLDGPSSIRVIPGSAASVDLALQRNETATDEVRLEVDGLPDGVTATFEPAVLPSTSSSTTLHLQAARDVERGGFLVTVRATGTDSLIAERQFALDIRGLSVEGRVHSTVFELPPESLSVRIGTQSVASNPDGTFSFRDVALPYDLEIEGVDFKERFLGLTTPTPNLSALLAPPAGLVDATFALVEGTVSPAPVAGEEIVICASGPLRAWVIDCNTLPVGQTAFALEFRLLGIESAEVTLMARRTVRQESVLTGFNGYAEQTLTIESGRTSVAALNISSASSTAVPLALADDDFDEVDLRSLTSFGANVDFGQSLDADEPVTHVPDNGVSQVMVMGATAGYQAQAMLLLPVHGPLDAPIELPAPLTVHGPEVGEALSPEMLFAVEAPGPGVNSFLLSRAYPTYVRLVHTNSDRIRLRDFGDDVNLEETYTWAGYHDAVLENLDALAEQRSSLSQIIAMEMGEVARLVDRRYAVAYTSGGELPATAGATQAAPAPRLRLPPLLDR